jgi:poly(3-hydroxybutyrate) depolymerase
VSAAAVVRSEGSESATGHGVLARIEGAGESRLGGFGYAPERAPAGAPLLVAVHGISRNAYEQARAFERLAEARGWLLLAPEFDAERHDDYQRLGRVGRGARADRALEDLIDRFLERFSRAPGPRYLVGYSAGAQFVHRYLMAHPERVDGAVLGSAGWYTFPDPTRAYPYGLRVGGELPGVRLSPSRFLRVPVLVTVGSRDTRRDPSLRQSRRVDRRQGCHRRERAMRWAEAMNELARRRGLPEPVRLSVLRGAGHDFQESCAAGLPDEAEAFFAGLHAASESDGPIEPSEAPLDEETT